MAFPNTSLGKVEFAESLKAEGNAFFGQGEWQKAAGKYVKIFGWTTGLKQSAEGMGMGSLLTQNSNNKLPEVDDKLSARIDAVQLSANMNLAQCYIKLNQPENTIKFANKALAIDKDNAKALFRRGVARSMMGQHDDAAEDLSAALAKNPEDTGIQKTLAAVKVKVKENDKKIRTKFAGMFDKANLSEEKE